MPIPSPVLPERAWFEYRGRRMDLTRFTNADGFPHECPKCGRRCVLDTVEVNKASGHPEGHELGVRQDGALTARPSVLCPHDGCGWHVMISEGVALDC